MQPIDQARSVYRVFGTRARIELAVGGRCDIGDQTRNILDRKVPDFPCVDRKVRRPIDLINGPVVGRFKIGLDHLGGLGQSLCQQ